MEAVDFVLYCTGISTVLVSSAAAIRLIMGGKSAPKKEPPVMSKREAIQDPHPDPLQERLQAFQTARYASPIIQRRLDADAGPAPRTSPLPPRRPEIRLRPDVTPPKLQKPTGEPPKEGS